MREKRIPLATPTMHEEEMGYVQEAFARNWIAPLGFNCDGFEKEMNGYLSRALASPYHTLALCSGTAALHLAVKLAGVKRGDTVLCSQLTDGIFRTAFEANDRDIVSALASAEAKVMSRLNLLNGEE